MRKEESVSFSNCHDLSALALVLEYGVHTAAVEHFTWPVSNISCIHHVEHVVQLCPGVQSGSRSLTDSRLKLRYTPVCFTCKAVLLRLDFSF